MKRALLTVAAFLLGAAAFAQQFSAGTNVVDYANYGTLNAEISAALGQRWSVTAAAKYNPFLYGTEEEPLSARQQLYALGARYWPWHVYSGWWISGKVQYQEYNRGGIRSPQTDEGDRYGVGLAAGFSYMLHPHINLEVGAGLWGGRDYYRSYSCPVCGMTVAAGERWFVLPNELTLALQYVF